MPNATLSHFAAVGAAVAADLALQNQATTAGIVLCVSLVLFWVACWRGER